MIFPFWLYRPRRPDDPPPLPTARVLLYLTIFGVGAFAIAAIASYLGVPGR